ncbi:MAG: alpha-1,4-glucan--maltose-1-phosphate maltosyltransferase, partial [Bacteroidales bacterium]|nr:alpha-1,4-glucan--maltose-1-phosphate maltosyltransferase [Bacteroidales bacterium]
GVNLIHEIIEEVIEDKQDIFSLTHHASVLSAKNKSARERIKPVLSGELHDIIQRYPYRKHAWIYEKELWLICERKKAGFSTWYEMFPRSLWNTENASAGNFNLVKDRLPYIADLGFDVLYFPPVHPIGTKTGRAETTPI